MGDGIDPAAGGVAQSFHSTQWPQGLDKRRQHRAIAGQRAVQPHLLAQVKDGGAMIPQRAADQ